MLDLTLATHKYIMIATVYIHFVICNIANI